MVVELDAIESHLREKDGQDERIHERNYYTTIKGGS